MNKKPTYDQLQKKIETLENKINKYEHDFKTNKKKIKNLSEAVKELNCLYGISSLVENKENSLTQILEGTVELLSEAWQDPAALICTRIIMDDSEFRTKNFKETLWKQSSDIVVNGERIGSLQIFHPKKETQKEKQIFIDNVAKRMGRIIEWKKVETLLRGSRGRLYQVIQNMPVMMDAFDSDWNIIAWNKECERVTGYRADEILDNPKAFELLYPDAAYRQEILEKTINQMGDFYDWEIDLRAKDGTIKTVSWSNISKSCPIPGWTSWAIGRDVTEHKHTRQLQMESERRLIEIINFLPDATFAVNLEGKVIVWNRAIEEMTGVKAKDMLGRGNYEYSLPFYGKRKPILIDLVLKPDSEIEKQYRFFYKEKNTLIAEPNVPLNVRNRKLFPWGKASPILDNNGNICGAIESVRDITARKEAEDALRASEAQKRAILDASIDEVGHIDKDMKIIWANQKVVSRVKISSEDLKGRLCHEVFFQRNTPCEGCLLQKSIDTAKIESTIRKIPKMAGMQEESYWAVHYVPLKNQNDAPESFIIIARNITDQKRSEQALKVSEEKFRTIFEESPIGIMLYDSNQQMIHANRACLNIVGVSDSREIKDYTIFNDPQIPVDAKAIFCKGESINFETIYDFDVVRRDNQYKTNKSGKIHLAVMVTPLGLREKESFQGCLVQFQDISNRKHAEKHIHTLNKRLIKVQESERQQLSLYLHDSVAQNLSSLRIGCETFFDNEPQISPEIKKKVSQWSKTLQATISAVRDISYDLYPAYLDQLGLIQTIANQCEDFFQKTGIKVDFFSAGIENLKFNFTTKINLYRVIQEALNNIQKHAEAGHVTIRIVASFPKIILRIEDDGKGFDYEKTLAVALSEKRMGLRSMQERVNLLNGNIRIQSDRMKGTKIIIEIPYEDDEK